MTDSARYDLRLMTPLQQELHSAEDDVIGSCFIDRGELCFVDFS